MPYKDSALRLEARRRSRAKHRHDTAQRVCTHCGATFVALKNSRGRTMCSSACRRANLKAHHPWLGKVPPQIVKARASLASRPVSLETRRRMSVAHKGRPISSEQRHQISTTLLGHKANPGSGVGISGIRPDLGIYLRSRWEANVARVFRLLDWPFQYEPFALPTPIGSYRPDFWVHSRLVEVKGFMTLAASQKIEAARRLGYRVQVIDLPFYTRLGKRYAHLIPQWEYPASGKQVRSRTTGAHQAHLF